VTPDLLTVRERRLSADPQEFIVEVGHEAQASPECSDVTVEDVACSFR
jgi:hypothetical protein